MPIHLDPSQRCEDFPITRTKVFMAHAAITPFTRRVCQAVQQYCQGNAEFGQWEYLWGPTERDTRQQAAVLFGCGEDEIAFISSTSMGLSLVAEGLDWQPGDNVLIADGDFPSNIYPWLNLAGRGVSTRLIPRRPDGAVRLEDIVQYVDSATRLVSLSSVNFISGFSLDVETVGRWLHQQGILFCVDAIQSLGAFPFSSEHVDFAVASSHKWLMGPMGIGLLMVKRQHFSRLRPVLTGWKSVTDNHNYLDYRLDFETSARRYEPGSMNGMGLVGLHAALETLLEAGIEDIAAHITRLRRRISAGLTYMGFDVISPPEAESGITTFTDHQESIVALRQELDQNNFVVSLRDSLDGRKCIRVAPHFYNTEEEADSLLEAIGHFTSTKMSAVSPLQ